MPNPVETCAHVQAEMCCVLQGLVASIESTMRESREGMKLMDRYKAQLYRIWPKEDVQTWVTSFNECMQQTQAAHDAAVAAAKNKGQVCMAVASSCACVCVWVCVCVCVCKVMNSETVVLHMLTPLPDTPP